MWDVMYNVPSRGAPAWILILLKIEKNLAQSMHKWEDFSFLFFRCVQEPLMREHGDLVTVPLIWGKSKIR